MIEEMQICMKLNQSGRPVPVDGDVLVLVPMAMAVAGHLQAWTFRLHLGLLVAG